jgi:hypothetical protein
MVIVAGRSTAASGPGGWRIGRGTDGAQAMKTNPTRQA